MSKIKNLSNKTIFNTNFVFNFFLFLSIIECLLKGTYIFNTWDDLKIYTELIGVYLILLKLLKKEISFDKKFIVFSILLLINLIGIKFNKYSMTFESLENAFSRMLMVTLLYLINDQDEYDWLFVFYVIAMLLLNIISIRYLPRTISSLSFRSIRLGGVYSNENLTALNNAYAILLSYYLIKTNKIPKLISYVSISMAVVWLYLTACRTAILALVLVFIIFFLKHKKKELLVLSSICFFVLCLYLFLNRGTMFTSSLAYDDFSEFEKYLYKITSFRYKIQKEGLFLIKDNLLTGVGLCNIKRAATVGIPPYSPMELSNYTYTHNFIIDAFLESGLFGGAIYIGFLFVKIKKVYLNIENNNLFVYFALITMGLIISMFERHIGVYMSPPGFFFWLSLCVVDKRIKTKTCN